MKQMRQMKAGVEEDMYNFTPKHATVPDCIDTALSGPISVPVFHIFFEVCDQI